MVSIPYRLATNGIGVESTTSGGEGVSIPYRLATNFIYWLLLKESKIFKVIFKSINSGKVML